MGVAVSVSVSVLEVEAAHIGAVIEIEHTVLIDSFHHIACAYVMAMAVGVRHDLNSDADVDDGGGDAGEMVWFVVVYNGFVVVHDTFHFGYLMLVCSAWLLPVVEAVVEFVLVQCYLDCSMVDEPLKTPVAAAAAAAAAVASAADTKPMYFDDGSAGMVLVLGCYSDGSAHMEGYFDGFVGTAVVN